MTAGKEREREAKRDFLLLCGLWFIIPSKRVRQKKAVQCSTFSVTPLGAAKTVTITELALNMTFCKMIGLYLGQTNLTMYSYYIAGESEKTYANFDKL